MSVSEKKFIVINKRFQIFLSAYFHSVNFDVFKVIVVIICSEIVVNISRKNEKILLGKIEDSMDEVGAVILEDYNKGLLTSGLIKNTIELCGERGIPVTVDPKFQHFMEYSGATLVKPNQGEVEKILGIEIHDDAGIDNVFEMLEERLECRYILLTRSAKGMVIKERGMKSHSIPTLAREVFDVSGAGDTVTAMVTLGLAADVDIFLSTFLANVAAGIGVERNGVVAVTADEVMERVTQWRLNKLQFDWGNNCRCKRSWSGCYQTLCKNRRGISWT